MMTMTMMITRFGDDDGDIDVLDEKIYEKQKKKEKRKNKKNKTKRNTLSSLVWKYFVPCKPKMKYFLNYYKDMNVLESKVNEGSQLTWQENVAYDHLEGHVQILESWFAKRKISLICRQRILEFTFDQPPLRMISCNCHFFCGCRPNYTQRIQWYPTRRIRLIDDW